MLWRNVIPKIVTSGTLSDDIGFDYNKNALLYISEKVPFPDKQCEEYIKAVADEITNLINATWGHTVILFTLYTLLSKVWPGVKLNTLF